MKGSFTKTDLLLKEAKELIPGPHSNLPGYELFRPLYITHGKGSHVYDVDGNDFIDYISGAGAGILGYGNSRFINTIKKQLEKMYYLENCRKNPMEIELAKRLTRHIPSAEKVRYLLSGTEAVQLAIRLARGFTKRNLFIRFDGHYHGWLDNVLGGNVNKTLVPPPYGFERPDDIFKTHGRERGALNQSFKIPWNDIDFLSSIVKKYGEQIALIIMEPINCNGGCCWPRPGYLETIRRLCDEYEIVLCFDEIITGFRMGLGGAQKRLGVIPDLTTLGKGIAAGIPFSAVVGKSIIMDQLLRREVLGAGTFNGYPLGMAAAIATIDILEKEDGKFYVNWDRNQSILVDGLKNIAQKVGIKMLLQETRGCLFYQFTELPIAHNMEEWYRNSDHIKQEELRKRLFKEGILILFRGRWFNNGSLTEEDVQKTLKITEYIMKKI